MPALVTTLVTVPVPAPALEILSVPAPVPDQVGNGEANTGEGERQNNHDPEECNVINNNMKSNFVISSNEDSEDMKNDFDVRG